MNKRPPATSGKPGKTVYDIRRENLNRLTEGEGRKTQLAVGFGVSQSRISHMLNGVRRITTDQAAEIEQFYGMSPGELDHDPDAPQPRQPPRRTSAKVAAQAQTNMRLVQDVVFAVTTTQAEMGVTLEPAQLASAVRMVLLHSQTDKPVDRAFVRDVVGLAKR